MKTVSLTEKYRPKIFEKVIGQELIVKRFQRIAQNGTPKPILLSGTVGSGKTTLARILGRALLCEDRTPSGSPCLQCATCEQTEEGDGGGLHSIPCNEGLTARAMRELVRGARSSGLYGEIVIILDEVQALSKEAFDALLTILEKPSSMCTFVLMTVDRASVPSTIRSRCAPATIKPVDAAALTTFMRHICDQEKILYEETALAYLSESALGVVRQAVVYLEQLREEGITEDSLKNLLDTGSLSTAITYLQSVFTDLDLPEQIDIVNRWSDSVAAKVELLLIVTQYVLFNFMYRHIEPHSVLDSVLSGDVESLANTILKAVSGHQAKARRICESAVIFWSQLGQPSKAVFKARCIAFNRIVNPFREELSDQQSANAATTLHLGSRHEASNTEPDPSQVSIKDFSINCGDAQQVWDSLSFMVQEYGVSLNIHVVITLNGQSFGGTKPDFSISDFMGNLKQTVKRQRRTKTKALHYVWVKDVAIDGRSRYQVAAHVPSELIPELRRWIAHLYGPRTNGSIEGGAEFRISDIKSDPAASSLAWHHRICRAVVRGLVVDSDDKAFVAMLDKFGAGDAKPSSASNKEHSFGRSQTIQKSAQKRARDAGLPALSAFHPEAWERLDQGWELQEHEDRKRWKGELEREKNAIRLQYGTDAGPQGIDVAERDIRNLIAERATHLYDRRRKWTIWSPY